MAHLFVGLGAGNGGRRNLVGVGQSTAAEGLDGDEAPVRDWWQGVAGELHELRVKLARRSRGSGRI